MCTRGSVGVMIAAGVRRCPRPKDDETVHPADARVCSMAPRLRSLYEASQEVNSEVDARAPPKSLNQGRKRERFIHGSNLNSLPQPHSGSCPVFSHQSFRLCGARENNHLTGSDGYATEMLQLHDPARHRSSQQQQPGEISQRWWI